MCYSGRDSNLVSALRRHLQAIRCAFRERRVGLGHHFLFASGRALRPCASAASVWCGGKGTYAISGRESCVFNCLRRHLQAIRSAFRERGVGLGHHFLFSRDGRSDRALCILFGMEEKGHALFPCQNRGCSIACCAICGLRGFLRRRCGPFRHREWMGAISERESKLFNCLRRHIRADLWQRA